MLARALAQEPNILLLDEPTSHLDISFQYEIMDLVMNLNHDHGITVVAVLHDLNLASMYCDRLVMVGQGEIKANGSPDEVITSQNIRRVYGAEVWVRVHPTNHRPYVIAGIKSKSSEPADTY
jgi:iron complex transport system ATP-binding protein